MQVWGLTEMAGVRKECQGSGTDKGDISERTVGSRLGREMFEE